MIAVTTETAGTDVNEKPSRTAARRAAGAHAPGTLAAAERAGGVGRAVRPDRCGQAQPDRRRRVRTRGRPDAFELSSQAGDSLVAIDTRAKVQCNRSRRRSVMSPPGRQPCDPRTSPLQHIGHDKGLPE